MIKIALVIGLAFVIQFVLSSFQMKNFNNEFVRLRRKGKVAIGRKSGGFHAGYCYTKRGIGTFVSEEEYMFDNVKKEMAEELLKNFVHEMRDLGFQKGEIIEQIADYEEEQK